MTLRYKLLPVVIKSALVLGQTNAASEQSMSVNARIVAQERASFGEKNNYWSSMNVGFSFCLIFN